MSAGRFPKRIKRGSCVVSIYKTPTRGYDGFTVVHYEASGGRCRRMFNSYAQAHQAAKETAAELAAGKPEVHVLVGHDLMVYRRALKALNGTGVDLDTAAAQFAQATRVLGNVPVIEAANVYNVATKEPSIQRKLVREVVEELLAAKRDKGRSALYLKDLRLRLQRVAKTFNGPLADLTRDTIDKFLLGIDAAPRTRNNFRLVIGTLLRFGQVRGYVAKDHPGISVIEKASHTDREIVVFTPSDMATLLNFSSKESGNAQQLKTNEPQRLTLYKMTAGLIRAYANLAGEMIEAGYTETEAAAIKKDVAFYECLRNEVKLHSGDAIDLKQYEPAMRHLIDSYIRADPSEVISEFDDFSLIELIVQRGADAVQALPKSIQRRQEAVAETIENNVRKLIIDESPINPRYAGGYATRSVRLGSRDEVRH